MFFKQRLIVVLLSTIGLFLSGLHQLHAQTPSTQGQEFWVGFMYNTPSAQAYGLKFTLITSSKKNCMGRVTNPQTGWSAMFFVTANTLTTIPIPFNQVYSTSSERVENKGLVVTTTEDISLYASNYYLYSYDVTNVLPLHALSDKYMTQHYVKASGSYDEGSVLQIIATEDDTKVDITPTAKTEMGKKAGNTFTITLDKGQSYQMISENRAGVDFSGTKIQARDCRRIAVFNGNVRTFVPSGSVESSDHLVEQAIPTDHWGTKFVVTGSLGRSKDRVKILALEDSTYIYRNGVRMALLHSGKTLEFEQNNNIPSCYIESSKPAAVYLYLVASAEGGNPDGDPSMVWISPVEQKIDEITFGTFKSNNLRTHHVNVVTATKDVASVTLDGVPIGSQFLPVTGKPDYSFARIDILNGAYTLRCPAGFTAHVYGLGYMESYAYSVGSSAVDLRKQMWIDGILSSLIPPTQRFCSTKEIEFKSQFDQYYERMYWDFGDGTQSGWITGSDSTFTHVYDRQAHYQIKMILERKIVMCNSPLYDTATSLIKLEGGKTQFIDTICGGKAYTKHQFSLQPPLVSDTYYHTLYTAAGCDSLLILDLTVNPSHLFIDTMKICKNDTILWRGKRVAKEGIYTDTLKTNRACDSLIRLDLRVFPSYLFERNDTIYENVPVFWRGKVLTAPGTYYDSLKTVNACDSIYKLNLRIDPYYFFDSVQSICNDTFFLWQGDSLYNSGIYYKEYLSSYGTDSVYKLYLTVNPTYSFVFAAQLCQGGLYTDQGFFADAAGTYWQRLQTADGCDSLLRLDLEIYPHYLRDERDTICQSDTLQWRGHSLAQTMVVVDSLQSVHGCDSVFRMALTVHPAFDKLELDTLCGGQVHYWQGDTLHSGGFYFKDYQTVNGCDSSITLNLKEHPAVVFETFDSLCYGESIQWRGHTYDTSGVYTDSLISVLTGCDSIYVLRVELYFPQDSFIEAHICQGELYQENGFSADTTGVYQQDLLTSNGCDSTLVLRLTVHDPFIADTTISKCDNQSLFWRGDDCSFAGVYSQRLTSVYGCDSIYRLTVVDKPSYLFSSTDTIYEGVPEVWRGQTLTEAGIYYDSLFTQNGCDSVYELFLGKDPYYFFDSIDTICSDASFHWQNNVLNKTGVYYARYLAVNGNDSVYKLRLTVYPVRSESFLALICDGSTYAEHGFNETQSGTYIQYLQTQGPFPCDCTLTLNLHVKPRYWFETVDTICEGNSYSWRGKSFRSTGVYYDSLKTRFRCDSVYVLKLQVMPSYNKEIYDTICEGQTYDWNGNAYTSSGTYYALNETEYGCDSSELLILSVMPVYFYEEQQSICIGDSCFWHGDTLLSSGVYYDSLSTIYGCDSIYRLQLNVYPHLSTHFEEMICDDTVYKLHGFVADATGNYVQNLLTIHGCDSTVSLSLHVFPCYADTTRDTICNNRSYSWQGSTYTSTGVYRKSYRTERGCDSVFDLFLQVNPSYLFLEKAEICDGQTYTWRGSDYQATGNYSERLQSAHVCDSVYQLQLTVYPNKLSEIYDTICQGETYDRYGFVADSTDEYVQHLQSSHACDSTVKLHLYVHKSYHFAEEAEICQPDTYSWRGRELSVSAVYQDAFHAMGGCDSLYSLSLTVHPAYHSHSIDTLFDNDSVFWEGDTILQVGLYEKTYPSQWGCDSVVSVEVRAFPFYLFETRAAICAGESYLYRGNTFVRAGIYEQKYHTVWGSDSIYRLILAVNPVYDTLFRAQICEGQTFAEQGFSAQTSGSYVQNLRSVDGCDSLVRLELRVFPSFLHQLKDSVCEGVEYAWRGRLLNAPGVYEDSFTTVDGCDSIYRLSLHHFPQQTIVQYDTICSGDSLRWQGQSYHQGGTYYASYQNQYGCDSLYILHLTRYPTYTFVQEDTLWEGVPYFWRGQYLSSQGFFYDSLQSETGCDSVYVLHLQSYPSYFFTTDTSLCEGDSLAWRGRYYRKATTVEERFVSSVGTDSVYRLILEIYAVKQTHLQASICEGSTYSENGFAVSTPGLHQQPLLTVDGCDSTVLLTLKVNPHHFTTENASFCENNTYHWRGNRYLYPGIYYDSLKTLYGCNRVYELRLEENKAFFWDEDADLCQGDSLFWQGAYVRVPKHYVNAMQTLAGCDSIYSLDLKTRPRKNTYFQAWTCAGEGYYENGFSVDSTGNYQKKLLTVYGCDSILHLDFTVYPHLLQENRDTSCSNQRYEWRGLTLDSTGLYHDSLLTTMGCHEVYWMHFVQQKAYSFVLDTSICENQSLLWRGQVYTQNGNYREQYQAQNGCDSVYELRLSQYPVYDTLLESFLCEGESYTEHGFFESQSGDYQQYLRSIHSCDSTLRLHLVVIDTALRIEQLPVDFCLHYEATLEAKTTLTHIMWSTGDQMPTITVQHPGLYTVEAYTAHCIAYDTVEIVECAFQLFIPSAFSPLPQDGVNDYYSIPENGQVERLEIFIFDRWGKQVFSSDRADFRWDGAVDGRIEGNKVYGYKLLVRTKKGEYYTFKGTITTL